jgi:UDP-N-acetylmuramate dehydrogenase
MSVTTQRALQNLLDERDREALLAIFGDRVLFDAPLASYTSWKIGGPADAFVTVTSEAQLAELMRLCLRRKLPWWIMGGGSNVLVGDGGIRGIVLRLAGDFAAVVVRPDETGVVVEAGASAGMALVTAKAASAGAAGIGSLAGIPGTIGGSLRMNAGTDREMGDFVRHVWVQSPSRPEPHSVSVRYLYRHATLEPDVVVSRVTLAFARADSRGVREEMQTRLVRRKQTQPVALPNAGSCFRNPDGGKAAQLIESVGAKGWREGGAEVSSLHANFINNVSGATARDVATLLARVRRAVFERHGIELILEVHLVGVFIDAT